MKGLLSLSFSRNTCACVALFLKKISFTFILITSSTLSFSQEKSFSEKLEGIQTTSKEITKSASTDDSNIGQSGEMTTSVPLVTVTSRTLTFPLQLNYSSGITSDQKSGPVGLGWVMPIGSIVRDYGAYEPDYSSTLHEAEMRNYNEPENLLKKGKFVSESGTIVDPACNQTYLGFDAIENVQGRTMPLSDKYHLQVPGMLSNTFYNNSTIGSQHYNWQWNEIENSKIIESLKTFEISQEFSRINEINLVHNASTNRPLFNSSYAAAIIVPPYVKDAYFQNPNASSNDFNPSASQRVVRYEDFESFTVVDANGIRYVFGRPLRGQKFVFSNDPYWSNHEGNCSYSANGSFWKIDYIAEWLLTAILSPDYIDLNENGIADDGDAGDWIRFDYTEPTKMEQTFWSGTGTLAAQIVPRHREWSSFSQTDRASSLMRELAYLTKIVTPIQEIDLTISQRFDVDHDYFSKPLNRYMNDFYFADKKFNSQGSSTDYDIFYPVETMKYDTIRVISKLMDSGNYPNENLRTSTIVLNYAQKGSPEELAVSSYLIRNNNNNEKTDINGVMLGSPNRTVSFDIEDYKHTSIKRGKTTLLGVTFLDDVQEENTKSKYTFEYAYNPTFDEYHKREIVRKYYFPSIRQGRPSSSVSVEPFQRALTPMQSYQELRFGQNGTTVFYVNHNSLSSYQFLIDFPYEEYTVDANGTKVYEDHPLNPLNDVFGYHYVEYCEICPQAWTLTGIEYPTGGRVTFEYEKGKFNKSADQLNWSFNENEVPVVHQYNSLAEELSEKQAIVYGLVYNPNNPPLYAAYDVQLPIDYGIRLKSKRMDDRINPEIVTEYHYGSGHFTSLPSTYIQNYLQGFNQFIIRENYRWRNYSWYNSPGAFPSLSLVAYNDIALDDYRSTHFYETIEIRNNDHSFLRRTYGPSIGTNIDYPNFSVFAFRLSSSSYIAHKPRLTLAGDNIFRIPITVKSEEYFESGSTQPYKTISYVYDRVLEHSRGLEVDYTGGISNPNELKLWANQFPIHIYHASGEYWETHSLVSNELYLPITPNNDMSYERWSSSKTYLKQKSTTYKGITTTTDYEYDSRFRIIRETNSANNLSEVFISEKTYANIEYANHTTAFEDFNLLNFPARTTNYLNQIDPLNALSARALTYEFTQTVPKIKNTYNYESALNNEETGTFSLTAFDYNSTSNSGWRIDQKEVFEFNHTGSPVSYRTNQLFNKTVVGNNLNLTKATFVHPERRFDATYTGFEDIQDKHKIDEWTQDAYLSEKWFLTGSNAPVNEPAVSRHGGQTNPCTGENGIGNVSLKEGNIITINNVNNIAVGDLLTIELTGNTCSVPQNYQFVLHTTVAQIIPANSWYQMNFILCPTDPVIYPGSTCDFMNFSYSEDASTTISSTVVSVVKQMNHTVSSTYARTGKYSYKLPTKRKEGDEYKQTPIRPVKIHFNTFTPTECNIIHDPEVRTTLSTLPEHCYRHYEASVWLKYDFDIPKFVAVPNPLTPKSMDAEADDRYKRGEISLSDNGASVKIVCDIYTTNRNSLVEQRVFYPEGIGEEWKQYTIDLSDIPVSSSRWIDVYVINEIEQIGGSIRNLKSLFVDDLLIYPKDAKYNYSVFDKFGNESYQVNNNDVFTNQRFDSKGRAVSSFDAYGSLVARIMYFEHPNWPSQQNHITERVWVDNALFNEKRYYLDGFGKTKQVMISDPDRNLRVVVESNVFDARGRVSRAYKPYVLNGAVFTNGYDTDFATKSNHFYGAPYPNHFANAFVQANYEAKPEEILSSISEPRLSFENPIISTQSDYMSLVPLINPHYPAQSFPAGSLLVHEVIRQQGQIVRTYLDAYGRVVMEEHQIGNNHTQDPSGTIVLDLQSPDEFAQTWFRYNGAGKITHIYDPEGKVTTYRYNSLGVMICSESPDKGRSEIRYDKFGQTRFVRNEKDLQAMSTSPYGTNQFKYMKYDKWGRVTQTGMLMAAQYDPSLNPSSLPFPTVNYFDEQSYVENQNFPENTQKLMQIHTQNEYDGQRNQFDSDALLEEIVYSTHELDQVTYSYNSVYSDVNKFSYMADGQLAMSSHSRDGLIDEHQFKPIYNGLRQVIGKEYINVAEPDYNFTWRSELDRFGRTRKNYTEYNANSTLTGQYYYDVLGNLLMQGVGGTGSGPQPHIDYVVSRKNIRDQLVSRMSNSLKIGLEYNSSGNITTQLWHNSHFDGNTESNVYFYAYDKINRLQGADYQKATYSSNPFTFFDGIHSTIPNDFSCGVVAAVLAAEMKPYFGEFEGNIGNGVYVDASKRSINSLKLLSNMYLQSNKSYSEMTNLEREIFLTKFIIEAKTIDAEVIYFEYYMAQKYRDEDHIKFIENNELRHANLKYFKILLAAISYLEVQNCQPNPNATVYGFLPSYPVPNNLTNVTPYDAAYWYKKNGNITTLNRNDQAGAKTIQEYVYGQSNTNRLTGVTWTFPVLGPSTYTYNYDEVGNLTSDLRNGVTAIDYISFNDMPQSITNGSGTKTYRYSATGQRTVKQNSANDLEYYLDGVILDTDGKVKIYQTEEGYVTPYNNNGTIELEHAYYVKDWLGTVRGVLDQNGNTLNAADHYPYGLRMPDRAFISDAEGNRYQFTGHEHDGETGYDYHGARYYNRELGRYMSVDPLAHLREWVSPYNFVQNNPINRVDPTGALDNPIYDTEGNFLGTDDKGIQGDAIVMNKSDFKQGMSHEDALKKGTTLNNACASNCISNDAFNKINEHHSNLPSRPDWDGHLTLAEANEWYRTGNGQPLFTDLSKIDLSGIYSLGESYVGQVKTINLLLNSGSLNDGLVYGNITLKRYPNHQVRAFADKYDFEMHNPWNLLNWGRNAETVIGRKVAGEGTPFEINIHGSATLKPLFPWIK